MKFIRWFLGSIILTVDFITRPRPISRDPKQQQDIDVKAGNMSLYQFKACPFCVKVRRQLRKHALNIELRDAKSEGSFKEELIREGGKHKVPCLRIQNQDESITWLYESKEIISYLETHFKLSEATKSA